MMKIITFLIGLLLIIGDASSHEVNSENWERFSDHDGITVYKREVPNTSIIAFRGMGEVDAPIAKLIAIFNDFDRHTEWVDRLEEQKVLRHLSKTEYIQYIRIGTPILTTDRDFVLHGTILAEPQHKKWTLHLKSVDDPASPKTQYIRGEIKGSFTLVSTDQGKKTWVSAEIFSDPKGSLAKWIVNIYQTAWPRNTLEAVRKQAKKDIPENPEASLLYR